METTGQTLTDVLRRAWRKPFKLKSDYARDNAHFIAMAASDGFITTRIAAGLYGHVWHITPKGIGHLWILGDMNDH